MEYLIFALAMFFFIVLIMIKGYWDSRQEQKKFVRKLYEQYGSAIDREYGPGELEQHISMYYKKHEEAHQIDDITWYADQCLLQRCGGRISVLQASDAAAVEGRT